MRDSDAFVTDVTSLLTSFRFLTGWPLVTGKQYLRHIPFPLWQAASVVAESRGWFPSADDVSQWLTVFRTCVTNFTLTYPERLHLEISALLPQFHFSNEQVRNFERGTGSTITVCGHDGRSVLFGEIFRALCRSQSSCLNQGTPTHILKGQRVIYVCRFRVAGKSYRYVGQTHNTIGRYQSHFQRAQEFWWSGKGTYFHQQLAKLPGVINFKRPLFGSTPLGSAVVGFEMGDVLKCFRVLERCDAKDADDRERYWIEKLDAKNRETGGCNATAGGGVKGRNSHLFGRDQNDKGRR